MSKILICVLLLILFTCSPVVAKRSNKDQRSAPTSTPKTTRPSEKTKAPPSPPQRKAPSPPQKKQEEAPPIPSKSQAIPSASTSSSQSTHVDKYGEIVGGLIVKLGSLFYMVNPYKYMVGRDEEVPPIVNDAVPFFFLLILLEFVLGKARGKCLYRINDSMTSISLGIIQQLLQLWFKFHIQACLLWISRKSPFTKAPHESLRWWIFLSLAVDFSYYWFHRHAHERHLFWGTHSVHHSGEDYNLATALRQGSLQPIFSAMYWAPWYLFFEPNMLLVHKGLNLIYQFWIHTSVVGWLGPLEGFINTPAAHRLHHSPPGNCNYGGFLSIWDRMFGTYQVERYQKDRYGHAEQVNTFDPITLNFMHYKRLWDRSAKAGFLGRVWKIVAGERPTGQEWVFEPTSICSLVKSTNQQGDPSSWEIPDKSERVKFDGAVRLSALTKLYLFIQSIVTILLGFGFLVFVGKGVPDSLLLALVCFYVFFTLQSVGRLFNDGASKSAKIQEHMRVIMADIIAVSLFAWTSSDNQQEQFCWTSCGVKWAQIYCAAMTCVWIFLNISNGIVDRS